MPQSLPVIAGRAAQANPLNRFETLRFDREMEHWENDTEAIEELGQVATQYFVDSTRNILARNDSPDVGFSISINPYRGCEHGCIYCYARPTHEYLGFSSGLDFESRIMVKPNAPKLLREALADPKYEPDCIAFSGVTDCYQPIERHLRITRGCLEVLLESGNPAGIVTKSALVTRDIDILSEMAKKQLIAVYISVTSLDVELSRKMEPRAPSPRRRLEAIGRLAEAGIPVGVLTAPVVPGLTDHEVPAILKAAANAGARFAGYVPLRLPFQVKELFADWLQQHFPDRRDKVLNRVREMRGGKLNDSNFATRMTGQGVWADELRAIYLMGHRKAGLEKPPLLSIEHFKRPSVGQMMLW